MVSDAHIVAFYGQLLLSVVKYSFKWVQSFGSHKAILTFDAEDSTPNKEFEELYMYVIHSQNMM